MGDLFLVIISGSSQVQGQSLKVARYTQAVLDDRQINNQLIDLHQLNLPIFGTPSPDTSWSQRWQEASASLQKAWGLVLVSPEYNGGPSPAILNLMLYVQDELRHKPVLTMGVSAGRGGTRAGGVG